MAVLDLKEPKFIVEPTDENVGENVDLGFFVNQTRIPVLFSERDVYSLYEVKKKNLMMQKNTSSMRYSNRDSLSKVNPISEIKTNAMREKYKEALRGLDFITKNKKRTVIEQAQSSISILEKEEAKKDIARYLSDVALITVFGRYLGPL